jgi:hypothetical protein
VRNSPRASSCAVHGRAASEPASATPATTTGTHTLMSQHQLHRTVSLIPTVNDTTFRSFSTHGQQSAARGNLTTVSRSDIRLIQHLDSSAHGLVRRWLLTGYFPIHLLPPPPRNFPTHGQLSAAQGNLTSCLKLFDFAILNLFEPSAL